MALDQKAKAQGDPDLTLDPARTSPKFSHELRVLSYEYSYVLRCILCIVMNTTVLTLRLDTGLKKQLDKLASATQRSRSFLAAEAIREYIALNDWQIEEIKKAVKEADRGDFAAERDVQKVMKKWTRNAG